MTPRLRVFIAAEHFKPAVLAGGPVRSLANLCDWLGGECDFRIYTRDRDHRATAQFSGVATGRWVAIEGTQVWYATPERLLPDLRAVAATGQPDLAYLNSLFAPMTRRWLLGRLLGLKPDCPVLLAPRGELGAGALSIRPFKKRLFLRLLRAAGLLRGVRFHATSREEAVDIRRELGADAETRLAPNFGPRVAPPPPSARPRKVAGCADLVFCSRLVPKKNLGFLLGLLAQVRGRVHLRVIGPEEDSTHVAGLRALAEGLPQSVTIDWLGAMAPDHIHSALGSAHFFVLPTLNENHGHGIVEAWQAELPVLISDQTPWRGLASRRAGWDLPLVPAEWVAALQTCVDLDEDSYSAWRAGAQAAAAQLTENPPLNEWRGLLDWAADREKSS
jgi:glycosyltransferase involved in cell wall biosynthesis